MGTRTKLCILLAEDHDDTRAMLIRLFIKEGYTVYAARSVSEARSIAAGKSCDLFIGDLGLPDGRGEDLMRELKLTYGMKGLAYSGYAYMNDIDAARSAGFDKFIAKPAPFDELLQAIEELMAD